MSTKFVQFVSEPYVPNKPIYMRSNECYLKKLPHTEPSETESTYQIPEFSASRTDIVLVDQSVSQVGHEKIYLSFYRPQTKFAKVMFYRCLSVHGGGVYPSMHWAGVCVSQHALGRGVSAQGVCAWGCRGVCTGVVSVRGDVCPGVGVCPRGLSAQRVYTPQILQDMVNKRAICILLECILLLECFH